MRERRYQLRKEAVGVVRHHPWLFRDHMSTAAGAIADGERVRLVDGHNRVVGHGVYASRGAIAIRVVRVGEAAPDAAWLRGRIDAALAKRAELAATTDGIRLVHGESDGVPAVVVDRFGDALAVTSYAAGFDAMARYVAGVLARRGGPVVGPASTVVLRQARRRFAAAEAGPGSASGSEAASGSASASASDPDPGSESGSDADAGSDPDAGPAALRVLRGAVSLARFREGALTFTVDLAAGQKTGAYLDLRGLRREVAAAPLAGARVLNLFAYTGMVGRAAEAAGAATILQVDASASALAFARAHHVGDPARHDFVVADVFDWLPAHAAQHDLVIVDPPAMTSRAAQVPKVLAAYRALYRAAARAVAPGGAVVAACCTSRVTRDAFRAAVAAGLGDGFTLAKELAPEPDHPASFPQADYLKIGWWRRRPTS